MAVIPHQRHTPILRKPEDLKNDTPVLRGSDREKLNQALVALSQLCANLRDLIAGDVFAKMHVITSHMEDVEEAYRQAVSLIIFDDGETAEAFRATMSHPDFEVNADDDGSTPTPEEAIRTIMARIDAPFHREYEEAISAANEAGNNGDHETATAMMPALALAWARWVVKRAEDGHSCNQVDEDDHRIIRDLEEEQVRA